MFMILKHQSLGTLAAFPPALSGTLLGQAISGNVVGTIRDKSGAMVVCAQAIGTNIATGIDRVATSGVDGGYATMYLASNDVYDRVERLQNPSQS